MNIERPDLYAKYANAPGNTGVPWAPKSFVARVMLQKPADPCSEIARRAGKHPACLSRYYHVRRSAN